MEQRPLTARQEQVLALVRAYYAEHGYGPTLRELRQKLAIASTNAVVEHLRALERKGYLNRGPRAQSRVMVPLGERRREPPEDEELLLALEKAMAVKGFYRVGSQHSSPLGSARCED